MTVTASSPTFTHQDTTATGLMEEMKQFHFLGMHRTKLTHFL